MLFILWAFGSFGLLGFDGFARANDVDTKIQQAVSPIKRDIAEINEKLSQNQKIQKRILASQLSAQLRDLNKLRCTTTDVLLRQRVEADIEEAEQEYIILTSERYPLIACKDI